MVIDRHYRPCLVRWVRSHRLYVHAGEEAEALVSQALATLSSLLGYLPRGLHHLVIDAARARAREQKRARAVAAALVGQRAPSAQSRALEAARTAEL
jgi:hypothetical protein